jgi:enamine deaminase RidA (YjgF/YER057c/UK114 family)
MIVEARLAQLGIVLPPPPKPMANYVAWKRSGNLLFLSGQGPRYEGNKLHTGKVGGDVSPQLAYEHARIAGLQLLAAARHALGDLDRVKQIVKLLGMVNAVPEFRDHPSVINGCSDLFTEVFGEAGRHARSAVGMSSLPDNITVEIEAVLEVADTEL